MTPDGDPEPKAAVALMAAALGSGDAASPAIGTGSTSVLAREILFPPIRRLIPRPSNHDGAITNCDSALHLAWQWWRVPHILC